MTFLYGHTDIQTIKVTYLWEGDLLEKKIWSIFFACNLIGRGLGDEEFLQ